ncbi:hypothetical protein [Acinetobacter baumannii]|uniref:hypothetical protein n=1 Tax=Acinetobacter baumannii TaxID=470 RepID=UPI0034A463D5
MLQFIKSDLYRYYGKVSILLFFKCYFLNRGFNYTVWLRLASSKGFFSKFARIVLARKTFKTGIDINYKAKIGYGLYIGHGGPLIINGSAIIGNNCNFLNLQQLEVYQIMLPSLKIMYISALKYVFLKTLELGQEQ